MLTVLYGGDYRKKLAEAGRAVEALLAKDPQTPHLEFDEENLTKAALEESAAGSSLFAPGSVVVIRSVMDAKEPHDLVLDMAEAMVSSGNTFFLVENELDGKTLQALAKSGATLKDFPAPKVLSKEMNMFALADALGARDKKQLWILLQKAVASGAEPEEVHGILFWQTKTLLSLAKAGGEAAKLGMKPFVIQKNQKYLKKYSTADLEALSGRLVTLYHESRRGGPDLATALEQFALSL